MPEAFTSTTERALDWYNNNIDLLANDPDRMTVSIALHYADIMARREGESFNFTKDELCFLLNLALTSYAGQDNQDIRLGPFLAELKRKAFEIFPNLAYHYRLNTVHVNDYFEYLDTRPEETEYSYYVR